MAARSDWTAGLSAREKGCVNLLSTLSSRLFAARGAPPGEAAWRIAGRRLRGAKAGVDFSDAWRLPDAPTAYLRTTGPRQTLFRLDRVESIAGGRTYRVVLLAAVHRCRAELVLTLADGRGRTIQELRRGVSTAARGGAQRGAYDRVEVEFLAPEGAERLTVAMRKGGAGDGQDSFLFVADVVVEEARRATPAGSGADLSALAGPETAPDRAAAAWNRRTDAHARRLAAVSGWIEAAQGGASIPDLAGFAAAIDSVEGGPACRPALSFPRIDEPEVSVILTSDADPDLLWRSLAALRFAPNAARFEVVLAGDHPGAAETLCALAEGLTVATPATGQGRGEALRAAVEVARGERVALIGPGLEPVAGWLDELLAVFRNFDRAGAVGPKLIESDGALSDGGNPRDPARNFVRPVAEIAPVMAARSLVLAAAGAPGWDGEDLAAAACGAARERGLDVLCCPTAECWRLPGCAPGGAGVVEAAPAPAFRVLFVDQEAPTVDMDAGGYAAFQEIRMLQALGAKVDFLPKNLAWMDRHTLALQRAGVECHYAPFVRSFEQFFSEHAGDYDVIFVLRHKIALLVQSALPREGRGPRLVLNLADLHFLRELREASVGTPGFTLERARATQTAELGAIAASDLTLTYSDVEAAVLAHHLPDAQVALAPWIVETRASPIGRFELTSGLMFLGGFGHPPNAEAAKAFVREVMPLIAARLPQATLRIVGSKPTPEVLALQGPKVEVLGYVADLDAVFAQSRIFVAPLLAGAGLKGKVIEAMARGVPMVLSPLAAEGTGLVDGEDCLIARSPAQQAEAIVRLHGDEALWTSLAVNSLTKARDRFSFDVGVEMLRSALSRIGVATAPGRARHYLHARPDRNRGASAAPAVLRLP
jgi:glycosyltransferase involved in cell wall biosynthesis